MNIRFDNIHVYILCQFQIPNLTERSLQSPYEKKKRGGSVNVFNATFNNISVISCRSVLLMDNTSYQYKVQFDFLGTSQLRMALFIFYSFS